MAFAAWLASELVRGASQATLIWASRTDCPACTCAPQLACSVGQEAVRADCPAPAGTWPLSAALLALVTDAVIGAVAARAPPLIQRELGPPSGQGPDDQARAQAALVRARQQCQQ